MPNSSDSAAQLTPDYGKIVKFLLEPLVDDPASLKVDCEKLNSSEKIWVRVAFEQEDKGKVFGRGGRNLKAIQTVLNTSAIAAVRETVFTPAIQNGNPVRLWVRIPIAFKLR